jgi:hypothetical protein
VPPGLPAKGMASLPSDRQFRAAGSAAMAITSNVRNGNKKIVKQYQYIPVKCVKLFQYKTKAISV